MQDPQRDIQEPYFTFSEFIDFLFSKQNDIWNQKFNQVTQDMTRPLAHYWIASSHNTYVLLKNIRKFQRMRVCARVRVHICM